MHEFHAWIGLAQSPGEDDAFRLRVLARGSIAKRADPFLSPCSPAIED
jgi:hypothetical protein